MPLNYKVFQHGVDRDNGAKPNFSGTSTVFYGEKDAVLIDAAMLLSDAHRLAANLIEMEKNLTHIYISHSIRTITLAFGCCAMHSRMQRSWPCPAW